MQHPQLMKCNTASRFSFGPFINNELFIYTIHIGIHVLVSENKLLNKYVFMFCLTTLDNDLQMSHILISTQNMTSDKNLQMSHILISKHHLISIQNIT